MKQTLVESKGSSHLYLGFSLSRSIGSSTDLKWSVPEWNENLRVWSASMSCGLRRLWQGVHVSLLEEKSRSQETEDACAGRMSIAS